MVPKNILVVTKSEWNRIKYIAQFMPVFTWRGYLVDFRNDASGNKGTMASAKACQPCTRGIVDSDKIAADVN